MKTKKELIDKANADLGKAYADWNKANTDMCKAYADWEKAVADRDKAIAMPDDEVKE